MGEEKKLGGVLEKPKSGEENKLDCVWRSIKPFVNGGASAMLATSVIQPLDTVKVRLQLCQESTFSITKKMFFDEGFAGFSAFYKGLSAGLLRQGMYTTTRLGTYMILSKKVGYFNDEKPLTLYQKALCGMAAGGFGALVSTPADLVLVRMQAAAAIPLRQRLDYRNAFEGIYRIGEAEGVMALWKGAAPTIARAVAINMAMFVSYDQSLEFCEHSLGFGELNTVLGASAVSGVFAAVCSLPFDYVKTQMQTMKNGFYTGSFDCAKKTLKSSGLFKFYTGFPVYCLRIAPHVMMTWIFLNQMQKVEKSIGL